MKHLTLLLLAVAAPAAADGPALRGLDPVLLTEGREVAGQSALASVRKAYTYHFSEAATRARFNADPARYEIQLDGACGRMGPASGAGSADRFLVHEGRIYIFASEQCRRSFAAAPDKYLDKPVAVPAPSADHRKRGRKLLEKALRAMGGAARVDGARTIVEEAVADPSKPGAEPNTVLWSRTGTARLERAVTYPGWGTAVEHVEGEASYYEAPKLREPMRAAQRESLRRELMLHPVTLLQARARPGFVAWAEDDTRLHVFYDGAVVTLGLDPRSGAVIALTAVGRVPGGAVAELTAAYSRFEPAGGLRLPRRIEVRAAGKTDLVAGYTLRRVQVDGGGNP